MAPLPQDLRRALERAVVDARETAEAGAANALAVLAVEEDRAPDGLSQSDRSLRVGLRARARSLGGGEVDMEAIAELREEIAYAAWHRALVECARLGVVAVWVLHAAHLAHVAARAVGSHVG